LFDTRVLGQADLIVVNNFFEFSPSQLTTVRQLLHEQRHIRQLVEDGHVFWYTFEVNDGRQP
jgi:hypothetical protein